MESMRVHIEKAVYGGEGIARRDGDTIFVPFVLPGEQAEIEIVEKKRKLLRGRVLELLDPSPARIASRCPHFGVCGGCDYQHASYDEQLRMKEAILRETLQRIGHIEWSAPVVIHKSPQWQYRNRAQWKVRPAADGSSAKRPKQTGEIGYLRARSSALCAIETCSIISPKLLETFELFREALAGGTLLELREIEAFANDADREMLLNVSCAPMRRPRNSLLQQIADLIPAAKSILIQDSASGQMALHGPGFILYNALQRPFRVANLSFFQVNRFLLEELAREVARMAGSGALAFDLYAGVGLFTGLLANRFSEVVAVEADPVASRDLAVNLTATTGQVEAKNEPAHVFLNHYKGRTRNRRADVAVVDPPRAGLDNGVAEQLSGVAPRRIIYVSCDAATLARDLAKLVANGYTVQDIHLFDIFPQTYHIESVVRLEREQ